MCTCTVTVVLGMNFDKLLLLVFVLYSRYGLDLFNGTVRDSKKAGVLEPALTKVKALKFAAEAAITILRIDDMIKLAPEKKPGPDDMD